MKKQNLKPKDPNQEEIKPKQNHTGSICLLTAMSMFSLMFYSLYRSSGSRFEQFFVAILFVFGVLPIAITVTITYSVGRFNSKNAKKKSNITKNSNVESKSKTSNSKIPSTEGYIEAKNIFNFATKKGMLGMENYFEIKSFIINKLGDNYKPYETVQWKNESHCIYSLLKSSKLTTEDYKSICQLIHDAMGTEESNEVAMEVQ